MLELLITAILTSAVDSLNPVAITQQFVLQGMVKRPRDIWYFILPTGITNFIGGFLAYYGLVSIIGSFFDRLIGAYRQWFLIGECVLGVLFLNLAFYILQSGKQRTLKKQMALSCPDAFAGKEESAAGKIKSVSPPALVLLGVGATLSELATALPYFAFMAVLLSYRLSLIPLLLILLIYNTIYTLPLMLLYLLYRKAQSKFDWFYHKIKAAIEKWSDILAPLIPGIIGIVLLARSIKGMLGF